MDDEPDNQDKTLNKDLCEDSLSAVLFYVIGKSYHIKRSARMRRGASNEDVAAQPRLARDSVETESILYKDE